jgi:hypothetical protein
MEISWLQLESQLTLMQGNQEEKMTKESVGIQSSIGVNPELQNIVEPDILAFIVAALNDLYNWLVLGIISRETSL